LSDEVERVGNEKAGLSVGPPLDGVAGGESSAPDEASLNRRGHCERE